jgi:hypothetical protein
VEFLTHSGMYEIKFGSGFTRMALGAEPSLEYGSRNQRGSLDLTRGVHNLILDSSCIL